MEGYGPSTYGDGFADVYDDWYGEVGDPGAAVDTIASMADGGAVLELGVGSGRLAAPLAARGLEVWGLEGSAAMLERLGARPAGDRVHGVLGDMADPVAALRGTAAPPFAVVVAAFNTFFLLASEAAQRSCLDGVAALLAPGASVIIEAYVPADPPADAETVLEPRRVGLDHVVFTISAHRPMEQVVEGQHVELRETGIRLRPWVLRYATPGQLDALAAGSGLARRDRWGGWDRRPFDESSTVHVSVYGAG